MPPKQVDGRDNGRTAYMYGHPVGVQCGMCSRRALVPLDRIGAKFGSMSPLHSLPLKCSACGGREVELDRLDAMAVEPAAASHGGQNARAGCRVARRGVADG
jgi:hypothetical protein